MIDVKIDFDDAAFIEFSEVLSPSAIQTAINRATRKSALWVRTQLIRRLGDQDIRRRIIVHRVRMYDKGWRAGGGGGKAIKVWFGIDPLQADRIAKPVKMKKGYRVKSWEFPGAFMPKSRPGKMYERTSKNRLPIRRSVVEISDEGNAAFDAISGQIPERMRVLAIHELKYEMHKALGTL